MWSKHGFGRQDVAYKFEAFVCINLHLQVVLVGRRNLQETGVYSELLVVVVMQGRSSQK